MKFMRVLAVASVVLVGVIWVGVAMAFHQEEKDRRERERWSRN